MHQGRRSLFSTLTILSALALATPACGGGGKADAGKADAGKADGGKADAGEAGAGETGAASDTEGAGETGAAAAATEGAGETGAAADTEGAGETGAAADTEGAGETGAAGETGDAADTEGAGETGEVDPAEANKAKIEELLKEASTTKTKDDRALEALDEAKTLEAEAKDLASAANKRGEKLMGKDTERATKFFEWAAEADPKYPNAHFNMAKMAALAGEFETTVEHLREVKKRGGKKLLKTVTYDPTFALVADDAEVLKLAK